MVVLPLILATWIVGLVFMVNSESDSLVWPVVFIIVASAQVSIASETMHIYYINSYIYI